MFSFLNRNKKREDEADLGNPLANALQSTQPRFSLQNRSSQPAQQTPNRSEARPRPQTSQAGQSSSYAPMSSSTNNRAQNYNPNKQQARRPAPQAPAQQPQQMANPAFQQLDQNVLDRSARTNERLGQAFDAKDQQQALQRQLAESRMNTLGDISGMAQNQYGAYADQIRSGVDLTQKTADRQIGRQQQLYDDQRFQNEQARQERMKGLEGTLAGLGTLQSSALLNVGARVNQGAERQDRMASRDMQERVSQIQDSVLQAQQQAETLLQQEGAQLQQYLRQLQGSMDTTSIEYRQAVSALEEQAQQRVNSILDGYDSFVNEANMSKLQIEQEAMGSQGGLSDQFLQTGQPATREDVMWMVENPNEVNELFNLLGEEQPMSSKEQQERQVTVDLINTLSNSDLGRLSGIRGRLGLETLAGEGADTKALVNQLLARLTMDERGKLKGQGTITDAEQAMLEASVSALKQPGISEQFMLSELQNIKNILTGQYTGRAGSGGNKQSLQSFIE